MKKSFLTLILIFSLTLNIYLLRPVSSDISVMSDVLMTQETEFTSADIAKVTEDLSVKKFVQQIVNNKNLCDFESKDTQNFRGEVIAIKKPDHVKPGELFKAKIYIKNIGDAYWFYDAAECAGGKKVSLKTINPDMHASRFYSNYKSSYNGWINDHEIEMLQKRVAPGEIASFVFWVNSPMEADIYREVFTLFSEDANSNLKKFDDPKFTFDVTVGAVNEEVKKEMEIVFHEARGMEIANGAEKWIDVNLSTQSMELKIGEKTVRHFTVSTGLPGKHDTPTGEYSILFKQPERVGAKWPNYHMPHWQAWRWDGYGLHALPYLKNDRGKFWSEALDHIGRPVSHGCIRLLPWDAETLYNWTVVGTKVKIHY